MGGLLLKLLTGDVLGRVLDAVDKKVDSETERQNIRASVVKTWLQNRMTLPWWLDGLFIFPLAVWWASVIIYSMFWCRGCAFPQDWSIAGLPPPLDEWAQWIVMSRFGVGAIKGFMR